MIELTRRLPRLLLVGASLVLVGLVVTLGSFTFERVAAVDEINKPTEFRALTLVDENAAEDRYYRFVVRVPEAEKRVDEPVDDYPRAQWWCDMTDEAQRALDGESLLDHFLDVAVQANKAGQFEEAAHCIREAGYVATNAPMASRVLLEAADLVPRLGEEALEVLVGYELFDPEAESGCTSRRCGAEVRGILTCSSRSESVNAVQEATPDSDERLQARKALMQELRDTFYKRAFELMPTRQAAQAVLDYEIETQESVYDRVVPTIHTARGTARFDTVEEAEEDLKQTLRRRADSRKEGLCEDVERAENGGIDSCYYYDVLRAGSAEVDGGRFELFDAQFGEVFDSLACRGDAGNAHLAFYDETTGEVTRALLPGSIPSSVTCGSGGWGHYRSIEIAETYPEARAVQINLGGGSILSKQGCGLDNNLPSGMRGMSVWCQADEEGEVDCIAKAISETSHNSQDEPHTYRETALPAFDFDQAGRLVPDYTHVDESVWRPLESWLTRPVEDVVKAKEKIRDEVRDSF